MDITSPNSLWKDYDPAALPLNTSFLSEKTENDVKIKDLYFDGYTTVDGRVRAYVKISEHSDAKGVILYLANDEGGYDDELVTTLYGYGYTVAVLDYLGKSDKYSRYTLYPVSLDKCNCRGLKEFTVEDDAQYSNWYIWVCMARRAALLLKHLYGTDIFALGVGLGGDTVYKLASFEDEFKACATLLNIIPAVTGDGNHIINYHASLDNTAYATLCKAPLFMAFPSNAEDGSFDDMSELANSTASLKRLRIVQRAFICGINAVYPEIDRFFDQIDTDIMISPHITASNSEGNLYMNIGIANAVAEAEYKIKLYVSFCIAEAPFRNWMCIPTISLGGEVFMAPVNVCDAEKPIYAFANIIDGNNNISSSPVLSIIPKTLGLKARPGVSHRKIYDGSMGEDGWTSRDGGTVKTIKGPFGIDGITCDSHSIITLKLGDPLFKVPADTLLQLMLCGKPQTVNISVRDKTTVYSCPVQINTTDDWQSFSLSHINFKSQNGPLFDWSQILMLEFTFEDEFIIGSVLWV